MKPVTMDKNGVPILSNDDIELEAERIISYFDQEILKIPQSTPIIEFIENLHTKFDLERNYSSSLGKTKNGNVILGKTKLKPLCIFVDASLTNDPRFHFVLGHELGHVVLHRSVDLGRTGYEEQEIIDTEIDFKTGKKLLETPRDWLEWQANRFSSAILMPRCTIYEAVIEKQKELGINRNRGIIILEKVGYSFIDYKAVREHLEIVYDVNSTNVEYRLSNLGILVDNRKRSVKHISEDISELFSTE